MKCLQLIKLNLKLSNMKVIKGYIYKNSDGEFFTPAMTGVFGIVDAWRCDKNGNVIDINENPYPIPVFTFDLIKVSKNKNNYEYP